MSEFHKKYVDNIKPYFATKDQDDERLLNTINKFLKFNNLKKIEKDTKLLDLGSGPGSFVNVCKKKGVFAKGLDAGNNNINLEIDKINENDKSYDFISMINLIEHLKTHKNVMNDIKRLLKDDGLLLIMTPNFKYCYKKFYDDPTHVTPFTNKSIKEFLKLYDFYEISNVPFLVDKSLFFWKNKFKYLLASLLPFTHHEHLDSILIPKFLRGKSTSMISVSKIKNNES